MSQFTCKAAKVFLLSAVSAAMMAGFAFAGEMSVGMGKTTGENLRIREYPTTDCGVVATVDKGTTLAVIEGSEEGWYHVSYGGATGYVSAEYVSLLDTSEIMTYGKINKEGVGVYSGPSEFSDLKEVIDNGAYVTINGLENGWYSVKCKYGTEGYIRSEYLDVTNANGAASNGGTISTSGSSVVSTALRYKGYRYRYGAAGPSSFDCSGFTMFVYKKYGVSLPHSATQQWKSGIGSRVYSISKLQPGDLVFFNWNGGKSTCSHTGIYIGNNQIIHASSSRTGVIVTNLTGKYVSCFVGGKHIAT